MLTITEFRMKFGRRLQELRIMKGLTQEELAEKCDLDRTTIAKIENGDNTTNIYTLYLLCEALQLKMKDIFNFD